LTRLRLSLTPTPTSQQPKVMFSAISSYIFAVEEEVPSADGSAAQPSASSSTSLPSSSTTLTTESEPAAMVKVKRLRVTIGGNRVDVEIANVNDAARPTEIDTWVHPIQSKLNILSPSSRLFSRKADPLVSSSFHCFVHQSDKFVGRVLVRIRDFDGWVLKDSLFARSIHQKGGRGRGGTGRSETEAELISSFVSQNHVWWSSSQSGYRVLRWTIQTIRYPDRGSIQGEGGSSSLRCGRGQSFVLALLVRLLITIQLSFSVVLSPGGDRFNSEGELVSRRSAREETGGGETELTSESFGECRFDLQWLRPSRRLP